ncbi:MAG: hypothetical protein ACLPV2_18525 [Steroidobacteraceae bacterium]
MNDPEAEQKAAELKRELAKVKRRVVLPDRIQGALRDGMLAGIAESIVRWRETEPQVDRYRKPIKRMREIANELGQAIADAGRELVNIEAGLPKAKEGEVVGYRAEHDLRAIVSSAAKSLAFWTKMYASSDGFYRTQGRGKRKEFGPELTRSIWSFLRAVNRSVWREGELTKEEAVLRKKPLSDHEIQNEVLASISEWDGLPKLTIKTLKRRVERRTAKQRRASRQKEAK